nr:hypothetical protein [Tanacetum cinerariifolium]
LLSSGRGVVGCREWGCRSGGFTGEWGDGLAGKREEDVQYFQNGVAGVKV